jgi:hypothetical protein
VELKDPLPVLQLMSLPFQTQLTNAKEQLKQKKKSSLTLPKQPPCNSAAAKVCNLDTKVDHI